MNATLVNRRKRLVQPTGDRPPWVVRWIDPEKKCLTNLVLHPLTIMDCTLTGKGYMNLDEYSAQDYGKKLIETVFLNSGELSLLWHNNMYVGKNDSIDWENYLFFLNVLKNNCLG